MVTISTALHSRDDTDDVSRNEGGRGLSNIEDFVGASNKN